MEKIKFAHLSDPHILVDHAKSSLDYVFNKMQNPNVSLKETLKEIGRRDLDFIVISGDLVHEGETEDYECLKRILAESRLSIPVFLALGNHDRKDKFREAFLNEDSMERYYYSREIAGLQIVVLDSAENGSGRGVIDERQLDWLNDCLAKPREKGSVIVSHHPLFWQDPLLAIENSDRLVKIIKGSNVRGFFCGHIHKSVTAVYDGIFQSTAESTAFGFDYNDRAALVSERWGFDLCVIGKRDVSISHEIYRQKRKTIAKIPMDTLKAILE